MKNITEGPRMKSVYPIKLMKSGDLYEVTVPDFDIKLQGANELDAIEKSREAIGCEGVRMLRNNIPLPKPSDLTAVELQRQNSEFLSLVDVDFSVYRSKEDMRTIHMTVTIPYWMHAEAKRAKLNISSVLREALKKELFSAWDNK